MSPMFRARMPRFGLPAPAIALIARAIAGVAVALLVAIAASALPAIAAAAAPDPTDPDCCFYKVQGTVWYDQNGDGIKQGTEPPLPGWTVQALDNANNVVGTTTTNGAGLYNFDVPVGCGNIFKIKSIVQSGWTQTFPPSNGLHSGTGTGCTEIPLGPYDFGNNQPACGPFSKTYTLDGDFNLGTLNGVVTNSDQLELATTPTTWPYAWIANSSDGTLSKVDTNTGKEVARYYTGPPDMNGFYTGLAPSRTVVDANGNCWVANRNYGGVWGSVTQIALAGGIDWNANSVINTSQDSNNNGIIDPSEILPWGQDERVIRHYRVGGPSEQCRGLTLDKTGGLWVGLSTVTTVVKLNPNLPTATYNASQPPTAPPVLITIPVGEMPYGLALSPNGKIYMSTGGDRALEIDPGLASGGTGAGPAVTENIYHPGIFNYGLCVDRNCIVWFALTYIQGGGYGCMRWDPSLTLGNPANGWTVSAGGAAGPGRGICADFNNNIWMACNDANNSVTKFNNLPLPTVVNNYLTNSVVPIGIGAASDGNLIVTPGGNSIWTKINSTTGAIMPLVGPQTVGNFPYTYSDFTGAQVGISGTQQGTWTVITDAGTPLHVWNFVGWNQATPAGTSVQVEARWAQNLLALSLQSWTTIGTPGPQPNMPGRYIETRVRLQRAVEGCSPPFVTPILYDLTVAAICDPCGFANCPSDTTIPCTSPQGAEFFYTPPILNVDCDSTWQFVGCSPPPGFFPVGTTAVTCTAINDDDVTITCTFNVTVTGGCDHPPEGACCYRGNCFITDQMSCEAVGGVYMGDNTNCQLDICRQDCVVPPNNLVAWWPFNAASGGVTPNLAGPLTGGTLVNAPTPVVGQKVTNAYSFNGTNQYINVPHHNTLQLGGGDFSFDCWIRTTQTNGVATIMDKRSSNPIRGFAFFLFSGYPALQMADPGAFSNYILTAGNGGAAAFVADGNWHFVAVTVDRDDPAGIQFYVDGVAVGTPFDPVPRSGSLNNTVALLVGQRYPALGGGYLAGSLDELEIIRRELTASEVSDLFMADAAGKCPETCYATQNAVCCNGFSSSSAVTICNYSTSPQTYSFGLTSLNGGPGCGPVGANGFSPASGTVTVPAQSCVTTPIYVACPSQLMSGQNACYSVSVFNHNTGRIFGCTGSVKKVGKWCWKDVPIDISPVGALHPVPSGTGRTIQIMATNLEPANPGVPPMTVDYMIQPVRGDNGEASKGLSLNGLPPGEPVIGTLTLAPGQGDMFPVDVQYPDESLVGYDRLILYADMDGDGLPEPAMEVGVRNTSTAVTAVPDEPAPVSGPPADAGRLLLTFPNPFSASDAIRFRVDEGAPVREVKLRLYDLQGRLVKALILEEFKEPGEYAVPWDTRDNRGAPLRSGIYFLKLDVDKKSESVKIMIRP